MEDKMENQWQEITTDTLNRWLETISQFAGKLSVDNVIAEIEAELNRRESHGR
jgi:hypothetical protein